MIVAFASPVAAHAQRAPARTRVEGQWLEGRLGGRQLARRRMARARMAAFAWSRGYGRGFVAGRHPLRAGAWRRAYQGRRLASAGLYGRFWQRQRAGRMGRRWAL